MFTTFSLLFFRYLFHSNALMPLSPRGKQITSVERTAFVFLPLWCRALANQRAADFIALRCSSANCRRMKCFLSRQECSR